MAIHGTIRSAALCMAMFFPALAAAAEAAVLTNARDLKWSPVDEPAGAQQAALWGDPKVGDSGAMVRWKFNSKAADLVRNREVHIVVFAGTFTVEVGGDYRELGPGGFVSIPAGMKHTLGCEAAGECRFLVHHPGAVEVSKGK